MDYKFIWLTKSNTRAENKFVEDYYSRINKVSHPNT